MALMVSKNVPKDAVLLDETEATAYAWETVNKWDSLLDTWALRYGPPFLGMVNAFTGILINKHYRHKLKLGTYGFYASVIPITFMPGILTILFHRHLVSSNILLMKKDCPICYEMRSVAVQLSLGMAYPMVLGPASAMMLTHRYGTARIPDLTEGPKTIFKFIRKITKPFTGTLVSLAAFQLVASSTITYFEIKNNLVIRKKILEIEKKVLAEQGLVE